MALRYFCISLVFIGCQAVDQLHVWSSPSYLHFVPTEKSLDISQISHLVSSILGYSTSPNFLWDGLKAGNPFHHPEAVVVLDIPMLELDSIPLSYTIINDDPTIDVNDAIRDVEGIFSSRHSIIINANTKQKLLEVKKEQPNLLSSLPEEFNNTDDVDVQVINSLTKIFSQQKSLMRDGVPDIFVFYLPGLRDLKKIYGDKSSKERQATLDLKTSLTEFRNTLLKIYDGDVICLLISRQDEFVKRQSRSILALNDDSFQNSSWNLAPYYSRHYAVIFNLILFTMTVLSIVVFAIALFIWHMDPGRDSIIYRMTSQRMKKE